jgi:hypothetical protein
MLVGKNKVDLAQRLFVQRIVFTTFTMDKHRPCISYLLPTKFNLISTRRNRARIGRADRVGGGSEKAAADVIVGGAFSWRLCC